MILKSLILISLPIENSSALFILVILNNKYTKFHKIHRKLKKALFKIFKIRSFSKITMRKISFLLILDKN